MKNFSEYMYCLNCGKEAGMRKGIIEKESWWGCNSCCFEWSINRKTNKMCYWNSLLNWNWCDVPDGCLAVFKESEL